MTERVAGVMGSSPDDLNGRGDRRDSQGRAEGSDGVGWGGGWNLTSHCRGEVQVTNSGLCC